MFKRNEIFYSQKYKIKLQQKIREEVKNMMSINPKEVTRTNLKIYIYILKNERVNRVKNIYERKVLSRFWSEGFRIWCLSKQKRSYTYGEKYVITRKAEVRHLFLLFKQSTSNGGSSSTHHPLQIFLREKYYWRSTPFSFYETRFDFATLKLDWFLLWGFTRLFFSSEKSSIPL